MPLVATPVLSGACETTAACSPTNNSTDCYDQNILVAPVSAINGKRLLNRMRAVRVGGGQKPTIRWVMVNRDGLPINLGNCALTLNSSSSSSSSSISVVGVIGTPVDADITVKLRLREQLSIDKLRLPPQYEYLAEVIDPDNGVVEVVLPRRSTIVPGIYFAEMAIVNNDDEGKEYVHLSNTFYVIIERGLWSSRRQPGGAPSLAEIRLHLRDSDPAESFLLDHIRFDDAEIALAIQRPVQYWNEIPPGVGNYTTQNFPWRYHWLEAICANLFWMVAEQFRANNLQYSAAGVQVNDQDKEPNYEKAAERRQANWLDFVRRKKSEINLNSAYGGIGSTYGHISGYGNGYTY